MYKSLYLALKKMDRHLSADIICSKMRSVFREWNSRKTVSFEEKIMLKDKYVRTFSRKIDVTVFFFFKYIALQVKKNVLDSFLFPARGVFF